MDWFRGSAAFGVYRFSISGSIEFDIRGSGFQGL